MKIIKKILPVIILLLIIETLYSYVGGTGYPSENGSQFIRRLLIGFPFHSSEYTFRNIRDIFSLYYPAQGEWDIGLKIYPALFTIDILFAVLLAVFFIIVIPDNLIFQSLSGALIGLVLGLILFVTEIVLPELMTLSKIHNIALLVILLLIWIVSAIFIYMLSQKYRHKYFAVILTSLFSSTNIVFFTFLAAGFIGHRMEYEDIELLVFLRLWLVVLIMTTIYISMCFLIKLIHIFMLRKKLVVDTNTSSLQNVSVEITATDQQSPKIGTLRTAIILVMLMAVNMYAGYHFATVRKMQKDDVFFTEVVFDKLKIAGLPISSFTMFEDPLTFMAGCNTIYKLYAFVSEEDKYDVEVKKNILIPWIQVTASKSETSEELDNIENKTE